MMHHILRSKRNSNVITRDLSFSLLVIGPLTFLFVVFVAGDVISALHWIGDNPQEAGAD